MTNLSEETAPTGNQSTEAPAISRAEYLLSLDLYQKGRTAEALRINPHGQGGDADYGEDVPLDVN